MRRFERKGFSVNKLIDRGKIEFGWNEKRCDVGIVNNKTSCIILFNDDKNRGHKRSTFRTFYYAGLSKLINILC